MINPRAVAVQGMGFSPRQRLVQGFAPTEEKPSQTDQGMAGSKRVIRTQFAYDDALDIALGIILSGALE